MSPRIRRILLLGVAAVLISQIPYRSASAEVKNIILMVGDGAGYNAWIAASMYQGRWDSKRLRIAQVYDGEGWLGLACSTYPLNLSKTPTGNDRQDADLVYDPAKAWDPQSGYGWLMKTYTDSAASATALATGVKTFNNAINWSDLDQPISPTIAEIAKERGKSVGIVTSVQWSHATPACLGGAHAASRNDYETIANQMIQSKCLDVIMGAGNPDFDDNGKPVTGKKRYQYVGGQATWDAIETARSNPGQTFHGFRPVSTKAEFEALVSGPTPSRILGTAQVARTLQESRSGASRDDAPYADPFLDSVPSLAVLAQAALNVLDDNPHGLWLAIEGGAIDWASHDNLGGRMIEEQIEFVKTIEAVVQWVETNSNWDETLLILTADHVTVLIWGPNSVDKPFSPIVDRGKGSMPSLRFLSKNHSSSLVPVYARGDGSQSLADLADKTDPVRGCYVDDTEIFYVMARAIGANVAA
ncbi:MAG: alkaline phosphatase, partial [Planctomycetes bacterium]|nr:alkaline phosphatase [Planctomycetota bacterium]